MATLDARLAETEPYATHQRFTLTELSDHIMLSFRDGPSNQTEQPSRDFGYLRSHMKASLDNLLSRSDMEFEAVTNTSTLRSTISGFKKSSDALVRVDILVYGPRGHVAKTVGRTLSRNRLYLQTPEKSRSGIRYENPQMVSFSTAGTQASDTPASTSSTFSIAGSNEHYRVQALMADVYTSTGRDHLDMTSASQPIKPDPLP